MEEEKDEEEEQGDVDVNNEPLLLLLLLSFWLPSSFNSIVCADGEEREAAVLVVGANILFNSLIQLGEGDLFGEEDVEVVVEEENEEEDKKELDDNGRS